MCIHVCVCVCVCDALVTQWCAVSHRKLLHLIVVGQQKESPLKNTHLPPRSASHSCRSDPLSPTNRDREKWCAYERPRHNWWHHWSMSGVFLSLWHGVNFLFPDKLFLFKTLKMHSIHTTTGMDWQPGLNFSIKITSFLTSWRNKSH